MTHDAYHAVKAARNEHIWGYDAAKRYCLNRNVPLAVFELALALGLIEKLGR